MPGLNLLDRLWYDVRYAWRGLRRTPGFTITVVATLAMGLGLNGALFAVVDRIFVRMPAGVSAPHEIRRLYFHRTPEKEVRALAVPNSVYSVANYRQYTAIRDAVGGEAQLAAYAGLDSVEIDVGGTLTSGLVSYATRGYFSTFGVRPSLGRFFAVDEDRIDVTNAVAVISDALRLRVFGRDAAVLGKRISIAKTVYTIVGVAPPGFTGIDLDRVDVWLPLGAFSFAPLNGKPWYAAGLGVLRIVARVSTPAAAQKLESVASVAYRRAVDAPNPRDTTSTVIAGSIVAAIGPADRSQETTIATRLAGVALIVMLIACGNTANLLLVRATRRRREIAIRRALGVSRARLCGQLFAESVLLSTLAGVTAVLIAAWAAAALRALLFPDIHWADGSVDIRSVAFIVLASLFTGMLAGLAPALHATTPDFTEALRADSRSGGFQRSWMRTTLVVGQAALSLTLLVGAGLFVRSLRNVQAIDMGFDIQGLVTVRPMFHGIEDPLKAQAGPALEIVAAQLAALPGVKSVAMAAVSPMQGAYTHPFFVAGQDSVPRLDGVGPFAILASAEYARTLGVHMIGGRFFDARDGRGATLAAVVNSSVARVFWPGENPLGKCIFVTTRTAPCTTVVGVIDDARILDVVEKPYMQIYLPLSQLDPAFEARMPNRSGRVLLVRTRSGSEASVMAFARKATLQQLPNIDELRVTSMPQVLEPQLRPWRLGATLFAVMGALAAVIAAVGMYSVIAYAASQRAHEMAVRVTLGAQLHHIVGLVGGEGLRIVGVGIAIGLALTLALGRLVAAQLYGVSTRDPIVLGGAALLFGLAGTVATLIPTLRVARVDPARALRSD
ncbi:MAG TPA: ADOP family duplicated permease [Gemmatimonadaceae bacterium]|nr:ADOP family duplicated permease [Gemmatimonadaceae bacterium]